MSGAIPIIPTVKFHSKCDADLSKQLKVMAQIREHDKLRIGPTPLFTPLHCMEYNPS